MSSPRDPAAARGWAGGSPLAVLPAHLARQPGVPTRQAILDAALWCFAEHGFEGTSLNDIAELVGIRRPSLLHHFASKDAPCIARWSRPPSRTGSSAWPRQPTGHATVGSKWTGCSRPASVSSPRARSSFAWFAAKRSKAAAAMAGELGVTLRPMLERAVAFFEREMSAGRFRSHDAAAARAHRLRSAADVFQ